MSSDGVAQKTKRWGRLCGCLGTTDAPTVPAKQVSYPLPLSHLRLVRSLTSLALLGADSLTNCIPRDQTF
jgi:hypothetical protein